MNNKIPIRPMSAGRVMRLGRIVVSLGILLATSLFFATANTKIITALGWTEKIQILPLSLATSLSILGFWLFITLVFGRIYCSTACPLGTLQDVIAHIPRFSKSFRRNHPYHFAPAKTLVRYTALLIFIALIWIGATRIPMLVDPFTVFKEMAINFLRPIYQWIGGDEVLAVSAYSYVMSLLTLGALAIVAWHRGRLFCNTLCPVGNGLSIFSRFSIFHFDIDTDRCTNCRRCEYVCKAQCINLNDHIVDNSRCVVCFDCVSSCPDNAIRYTRRRKQLSIPMLQRVAPPLSSPLAKSPQPSRSSQSSHISQSSHSSK